MLIFGLIGLVVAIGLVYVGLNGDEDIICFLGILCGGMVGLCSVIQILYVFGLVH